MTIRTHDVTFGLEPASIRLVTADPAISSWALLSALRAAGFARALAALDDARSEVQRIRRIVRLTLACGMQERA